MESYPLLAANKNAKFMFTKTRLDGCVFPNYGVRSDCQEKF